MSVSPLQLSQYFVEELSLQINPDYLPGPEPQFGDVQVAPNGPEHRTDGQKVLHLVVELRPAEDHWKSFPYMVKIAARGAFLLDGSLEQEEADRLLLFNGSAILLGLMRAQVAQATALCEYGAVWIPTLNLVDLFSSQKDDSTPGELSVDAAHVVVATPKRKARATAKTELQE